MKDAAPRWSTAFLAVIAAQAAHSVEEFAFRLFDVFAPARVVSSLFSGDLQTGFAIANTGIVLAGVLCYVAVVRPRRPGARAVAWSWTALELANGLGHVALALSRGAYFPGVATAPLLVGASSWLAHRLSQEGGSDAR